MLYYLKPPGIKIIIYRLYLKNNPHLSRKLNRTICMDLLLYFPYHALVLCESFLILTIKWILIMVCSTCRANMHLFESKMNRRKIFETEPKIECFVSTVHNCRGPTGKGISGVFEDLINKLHLLLWIFCVSMFLIYRLIWLLNWY